MEVLNGPQGTLFGANTLGGTLRLRHRRAAFEPVRRQARGVGGYTEHGDGDSAVRGEGNLPSWLKRFWIEWLGPERILEVYTGAERQALVTISGDEWLSHPGSVGRAGPGAALRVLDDDGQDLPAGEVGEIFLRPDAGCNATYHCLGAKARARGEWESLGDLGHVDADGYLYLSDRRHDLIIRGAATSFPPRWRPRWMRIPPWPPAP